MEEKKDWKKKIPMWIKEDLFEEVTDDRGTRILGYVNCSDKVLDFIEQELDKAREEGRREYFSMGMEYFSLIEDSNIYQQKGWKLPEEKAKRLQILEKIFNLITK